MICPACRQENRAGRKFCAGCGTPLARLCAACGTRNDPGERFCGECGAALESTAPARDPRSYTPKHLAERILTTRSAFEGERKQVTVLFADVAGFTAISEKLDPEAVHAIMDGAFRILLDEIHRYEGTINQFTGDGVMALFGAPLALEDAPERALRAALGIQTEVASYAESVASRHSVVFQMRIGVHTGRVVVGKIGDDLRMDYTAVGDTTNLAARLQQHARPGTVLASDRVVRATAGRFVTQPVDPLVVKGKSTPVRAHEVLSVVGRAPLIIAPERGLTPFVGRAAELTTLLHHFEAAATGRGQIVEIVGDAGLGKSRLLHEFRQHVADRCRWIDGRSTSFGGEIPFLPLADLLRYEFSIEDGDGEAAVVAKVRGRLRELNPELEPCAVHLLDLLSIENTDREAAPLQSQARRAALFDALTRLLVSEAAERPLVVVIEDVHWIDTASEEYLADLADALPSAAILLLCTHRPGYRSTLLERSYASRLALQALTAEEGARVAASVLGDELPEQVRDLVARKAEGNPFFIEEVTQALAESGVVTRTEEGVRLRDEPSAVVVPDTIQEILMSRIDRLAEGPKQAIQIASVIGREFAARLLERVTEAGEQFGERLAELRSLELILEKSTAPELAYMFKHALTHDVAYSSLLLQHRRTLHRVIARAIEQLYADRLTEHWEVLAHHLDAAEEWPDAFQYLVKAGDKARTRHANREAIRFYERALVAAGHIGLPAPQRSRVFTGIAISHMQRSEYREATVAYRQALALADTDRKRAWLRAELAYALGSGHEFDEALVEVEAALSLARDLADDGVAAGALGLRGMIGAVRGEPIVSEPDLFEAKRLADRAGALRVSGFVASMHAGVVGWRGEYARGIEMLERAIVDLRASNSLLEVAVAQSWLGMLLGGKGEYATALAELDEGIALARTIGDRVWSSRMWNTRGWILGELGAFEGAEESNLRCVEIATAANAPFMVSELVGNAEANLADAALARGDPSASEPHLSAVSEILADRRNEWMTWRYRMHYQAAAAELALVRGDLAHARHRLDACLATAKRTRSRRYEVRATRIEAACHLAAGNLGAAEARALEAVRGARELRNPPQLWRALLVQGDVLAKLGRRDDARASWREALASVRATAETLPAELSARLRSSPLFVSLGERAG